MKGEKKVENKLDTGKVLVIDDEQVLRDGAERILTRMNFQVFKASRGDEGLKILEKEPVSIVLLDMKMPGMDGMEVLKCIMEMERGILVIVITGFATVETAIEAMKRGAYDFIPKPYEPEQLRIVVNRAREKMQLQQETEKLEKERRRTLADLHTSQSRVYTIIESLPNGVLVTDTNGKVVLLNPAFRQHLGIARDMEPGGELASYIDDENFCKLIIDISR
ncbi:MAG: response regulator, partial [Deltaproteobacteria bacterium]|nr:response regulator [Deltaproteobacteria bacterium]